MTRSNDSQKIIVVGIPKTLDDAQLSELFSEFGAVAEAKVVLDAASNVSRGFGFVTFTSASAMRNAIKSTNRKVVQGRTLNVRQLVPKDEFQSQKKETEDVSQRPCWLLRKGKCSKGANCPFSHDIKDGEFGNCFEFVQTGECKHGDKCKFSHPQNVESVEDGDEEEKTVEKYKTPEKRVCYSFQNGRCHRGKKCLYAHELLVKGGEVATAKVKKGKEEKKAVKEPFEVIAKTELGKKRRRSDEETESEEDDVENAKHVKTHKERQDKASAATGLAAHVNNFMSARNPTRSNTGPKKFEWKAKVASSGEDQSVKQEEKHAAKQVAKKEVKQEVRRTYKQEVKHEGQEMEELQRPVKKMKIEKVDMGAAFDGVSEDESGPKRGGKKPKVDKETMRANREKLKQDRRAKRGAKKSALSKLLTKGEVELDA
ncbi:hypothetical protein KRP22_014960 [Phytophthora ramorum]|nr:Zinc finger CCCH domain-containing protein 42 [Phytophthora ramorum]